MAVWSEVSVKSLFGAFRLDAECYTPEMIGVYHHLAKLNCVRLGDHAYVTDGQHGYHKIDPESPIRHLTAKCIDDFFVNDAQAERLALETHQKNLRSSCVEDDVLLSTAGTLGNAAVVTKEVLPANMDQDVARIHLRDDTIDPWYLVAFLDSQVGRLQSERVSTGQVQKHIALEKIREFSVPVSVPQKRVAELVKKAYKKRGESLGLYAEAENFLLKELGLADLDLSPQLFYERRYSETLTARRLDAEYFSPRVQRALAKLRQQGETIGDVAKVAKRRFRPERGRSFNYIEIGDVQGDGSAIASEVAGEDAPSRAVWVVQPGDVITSTVRPIRRLSALIGQTEDGFVCSSGFAVLRPSAVPAELLLVYLRLPIIAEILDLHTTASMYPAVSTPDLLKIPFLAPSETTAPTIAEKIRESRTARQESQRLLADAKRMVEEMIVAGGAEGHSLALD